MIKNISVIVLLIFLVSCNKTPNDYVTITGLIANNQAETIKIVHEGYSKSIEVNADGTFTDTLKIPIKGFYRFTDGKNKSAIHLEKGNEIDMQYDYTNFEESVKYSGIGFETTKYFNDRNKFNKKENIRDYTGFYKLTPQEFEAKILKVENGIKKILLPVKIDSTVKAQETVRNTKLIEYLRKNYAKNHADIVNLAKGKISPKFFNYENYNGGKTSLDDFKGKFVYIDVWATWCGPCKREIPQLKRIIKKYKEQDIVFISISVDNGRGYKNDKVKAKEAWRKMIKEKGMSGVQLYADKAWNSSFIKEYNIRSIPRFILIDKEGAIINAKAPRPSSSNLEKILNELLK